jgi:hypothetical protein
LVQHNCQRFALRREISYRLLQAEPNRDLGSMNGQGNEPDRRGGGDRVRTDAFRYAPGLSGLLAFGSVGVLGAVVIAVVAFDLGGARSTPGADWAVPAGAVLILAMSGLLWVARRAPVLLTIGPEGLNLPAAFARPVAWAEIWRIRLIARKAWLQPRMVFMKVELMRGMQPVYQRRLWTMPRADAWLARKIGLRIPIHNLDAAEEVILASVERFKPVQRVTP